VPPAARLVPTHPRPAVVKRCDGGFDDSWLGSDSDASDGGVIAAAPPLPSADDDLDAEMLAFDMTD